MEIKITILGYKTPSTTKLITMILLKYIWESRLPRPKLYTDEERKLRHLESCKRWTERNPNYKALKYLQNKGEIICVLPRAE